MEYLEQTQSLSAGEMKIEEYVSRIKNGESKDAILKDLPESFRVGIENRLSKLAKEQDGENIDGIPPQYEGLDSETLDFIWTIPEYVDPDKTRELREKKARVLASLREKESAEIAKKERREADGKKIEELRQRLGATSLEKMKQDENIPPGIEGAIILSIEERKKLHGWNAGYELAKIAKQQGLDLSKISREDYVEFAIKNYLVIDDSQLRMAPWQRMATSAQEIVSNNKKIRSKIDKQIDQDFAIFCSDIQIKARGEDRFIEEGVKVRQGTGDSNSWLFFGINKGIGKNSGETYKSYISVKDLNTLTPARFKKLMVALKDAGYNGDIKIFQDLSTQGVNLNDQIVMHGASQADAELAMQVAETFFGADLDQKSVGKDEVVDGENKSYSQILADKIKRAVKSSE